MNLSLAENVSRDIDYNSVIHSNFDGSCRLDMLFVVLLQECVNAEFPIEARMSRTYGDSHDAHCFNGEYSVGLVNVVAKTCSQKLLIIMSLYRAATCCTALSNPEMPRY